MVLSTAWEVAAVIASPAEAVTLAAVITAKGTLPAVATLVAILAVEAP